MAGRSFLSALLLFSTGAALAQPKALPCFFSAPFEEGGLPDGWDAGPEVEQQDAQGNGLGTFTSAWTVGDAVGANANGYFPVPDIPFGNRFLMVNDDAPPCNCAMNDVAVSTPAIDLTGRSNVMLEARVFNEQEFGAGPATVEAQVAGGEWTELQVIPAVAGAWQALSVDLSAYDGLADVRLRFRWSDGGGWAGGIAVDDICLREQLPLDLTVVSVHPNNITISPFVTGDQSLRYHMLPLEQATAMTVSAVLRNNGTDTLFNIGTGATITLNSSEHGPFAGSVIDTLAPGVELIATIATGWTADATGQLTVVFHANVDGDEDPADNSGQATQSITGHGWDDQYSAMAADAGSEEGTIGGTEPFIAMNRFELVQAESVPHGLSAFLGTNTAQGTTVRAILMDHQFATVDTSERHIVTDADIASFNNGAPLYLPFTSPNSLAPGDYHAGIQRMVNTGDGVVEVLVSGTGPIGASVVLEGISFLVNYIPWTPMVRLHLSAVAVGVAEDPMHSRGDVSVHPVPMDRTGTWTLDLTRPSVVEWHMVDVAGRRIDGGRPGLLGAGHHRFAIDSGTYPAGMVILKVRVGDAWRSVPIVVVH